MATISQTPFSSAYPGMKTFELKNSTEIYCSGSNWQYDSIAWRRTHDKPLSKPNLTKFTDAQRRHLSLNVLNQ